MINADDPSADYFTAFPADKVVTYGIHNETAQYRATEIRYTPNGSSFNINAINQSGHVREIYTLN